MEQIEEFVAFMGAYEIESMFKEFEDFDDAVYRPENLAILKYCYENYEYNYKINALIKKVSAVQEETNILQESMEEEINEIVSSLDEKDEEESEEQKEEERLSYPCPPSNESNSSTHTLFNFPSCLPKDDCYDDCYDPIDSLEISLFDDACYACGQDTKYMNYACGYELVIVPYVKHEIVAIAPTHDSPIIFLILQTTLYRRSLPILRIILMGCLLPLHMMILMNIICMWLLLLLAIIMREELYLHLSMFPT